MSSGFRYGEPNAIGYAGHRSSHDAVIRVYDDTGNVIETHEHRGEFKRLRITRDFDQRFQRNVS